MSFVPQPNYRLAIRTEGMVEDLVKNLSDEHPQELQMHCASAIFKVCSSLFLSRNSNCSHSSSFVQWCIKFVEIFFQ